MEMQSVAKIYTLQGQLLLQENVTPENPTIDISELAEGLYILKQSGSTGTTVAKFVKSNRNFKSPGWCHV